jgi:hypothetical protein
MFSSVKKIQQTPNVTRWNIGACAARATSAFLKKGEPSSSELTMVKLSLYYNEDPNTMITNN